MNEFQSIIKEVKKVINGKDRAITIVLLAIFANGNVLVEDIPGVGKTTMAVAFSKALGLKYKRMQFTPDTLPSDITGFTSFNRDSNKIIFNKGAVFCNLFLADELNRTSSRTQSALLEAMEEHQVSIEGKSYPLENPFSVIATQNPVGASGTQLLPDSQTDRFMVRISMGYPEKEDECKMLYNRSHSNPMDSVECVVTKERLIEIQKGVADVYMKNEIIKYIVELINATRNNKYISRGGSPRATLAVASMAKAVAFASGKDYVTPNDVQNIFVPTMSHRIILSSEAVSRKLTPQRVLKEIISQTSCPRI